MSIWTKIFGKGALDVAGKVAGIADRFIQTKEEKAAFEMEMEKILIEAEAEIQKNVIKSWPSELSSTPSFNSDEQILKKQATTETIELSNF